MSEAEERNNKRAGEEESVPTASFGGSAIGPGGQIGPYKLLSLLGEGGFAVVYLAEQERPVKRRVALKIIKPGMDSKQVIARFEAERQALALLDHPNIAQVYDAGTTGAGRPYFVMEHVKGLSLTEHCDREKLGIEERLGLFLLVCEAVQHAHQKGIIHRDIKPSNILVSIEGERAIPKIIDFGVAKAITQPLTERTLFTERGQLIGTPEYMSPEQAEMAAQDIDTRSDIYSLGVVLYELLAGALPFDRRTLEQAGFAEIQRIIREQDPPLPSTKLSSLGEEAEKVAKSRRTQVAALAKRLHKELEWIPLKAMRKERTRRYRSASEFADDIQNYLTGAPLLAGPESAAYRIKKFARRNRVSVTAATVVAVAIVLGLVVSTAMYFKAEQAREKEAIMRAEAERQGKISQAVVNFLTKDLLASVMRGHDSRGDVTMRSALDAGARALGDRFSGEPLAEASICEALGNTYRRLGECEAARPHLERAYHIRREELGEEHPYTLESMRDLAQMYLAQKRYDEAQPLLVRTLEGRQSVLGEEHRDTLESLSDLALVFYYQGRYDKAKPLLIKALEIGRRVLGDADFQTQTTMGWLAKVYREQGRNVQAEPLYVNMLEIRRRVLGEEYEKEMVTSIVMKELIKLYETWGRPQQAKQWQAELQHLSTTLILHFGDWDKYIQLIEAWKTTPKREEAKQESPFVVNHMGKLADWYSEQGRYEEAETLYLERLEIQRRVLGEEHGDVLSSMIGLAGLYYQQGRYDDAEVLLLGTMEIQRRVRGEEHASTLECLNNLIELYEAWGKPEKAKEWGAKLPDKKDIKQQ